MKAMGDSALGKTQKGDEHMKEGIGFTKKTFTRWKPDWTSAVLAFEAAVKAYKQAKNKEKLIEASMQLGAAQCEVGAFYNAGNALLEAAEIMAELGNVDGAVSVFDEAHQRYLEGGSGKEAGNAALKCGKALVKADSAKAEEYFSKAMFTFDDQEAWLHARECYNYIVRYYVGAAKWDKALESLEKQIDLGKKLDASSISCKAGLAMCVIHLSQDEYGKAVEQEKNLQDSELFEGWLGSSERTYLRKLLNAWQLGNQEMADSAAKDCALCLTGELVRMVKKLQVPEDGVDIDDEPAAEDEDDDDPDGIC